MSGLSRIAASVACVILTAGISAAHAASIRTITDVWGGSGNGSIAQGCTTYGSIPDLGNFFNEGGFRVLGGNTTCGYVGVTSDQTLSSGSLLSLQTLAPTPLDNAGSTYQGSAGARASFGSLGVSVQGKLVGESNSLSAVDATGAAFFEDTLSATSPFVAPSAPGFVRYVFSLDGSLSTLGSATGAARVYLNLRQVTGPVIGLGRLTVQGSQAAQFYAIDSSSATWALGSGVASGAGLFGSTMHSPFFGDVDLPMVWGSPWEVQVGLMAISTRSEEASFMSTAKLVDIELFDSAHRRITDFSLTAASGTDYFAAAPVPEPQTWLLMGLGLLLGSLRWRKQRS